MRRFSRSWFLGAWKPKGTLNQAFTDLLARWGRASTRDRAVQALVAEDKRVIPWHLCGTTLDFHSKNRWEP